MFLIKRYEICLDPKLTLNPAFFDATKWRKGKHISALRAVAQQFAGQLAATARVGTVTFQAFSFPSAQAREEWKRSAAQPHREFARQGRLAQLANHTVNLYFDYEEEADEIVPNVADIRRSTYNTTLSAYSLGQQKDLLAAALKLQF